MDTNRHYVVIFGGGIVGSAFRRKRNAVRCAKRHGGMAVLVDIRTLPLFRWHHEVSR